MGDDIPDFPETPDVRCDEKVEWDGLPVLGEDHDEIPVCFGVWLWGWESRCIEGYTCNNQWTRLCKGFGICDLLMSIDEVCDIGNQIEAGGCDRR